jgi:hypothetical protein
LSPLDSFFNWYDSLPLSHRHDIAGFAFGVLPGYTDNSLIPVEGMETRFKDHVSATSLDKLGALGNLLALRALIEFFFVRTRSTREQWAETNRFLSDAKSFFDGKGQSSPSQTAETALTELEFRAEQWLRTTEKWRSLATTALSDEAIDAWWRER